MSVSPKTGITDLDNFIGAAPSSDGTRGQVPTPVIGDETKFLRGDGTWQTVTATSGGSGTVTYVDVSGGLTGLLFTGGPVTASGIITASGTLGAGYGGTGKSTYAVGDILYATGSTSLKSLTIGASGQVLTASAGVPVWSSAAGTVDLSTQSFVIIGTSSSLTGYRSIANGFGLSAADSGAAGSLVFSIASTIVAGGPVGSASTSAVITFTSGGQLTTVTNAPITPTAIGAVPVTRNVFASGALTGGGDLSADRTITLASIIAAGGPIGTASTVPVITYDAYGRITVATNAPITPTAIGAVPVTRTVFASGALTGGGALSGDITIALASIVAANTVGSTTRIPVVTFDAYGRITTATDAAITSSGGGSGSTVYTVQANVDFGFPSDQEGDIATVTVSATWVVASSIITVSPYAVATADHDPEDYAIEGITAYAANLASGVGFDIIAAAPNNSWGRYTVNAHGV